MPDPSARAAALFALQLLLARLFLTDLDALRFLLSTLPGYGDARLAIPDKTGLAPLAYMRAVVEWLEGVGLVRAELFEALVARSPARERDIRTVQRSLQRIVLFIGASPPEKDPLDLEADAAGIVAALHASFADPAWAVVVHQGVTLNALVPLVLRWEPDVLHFSGHGDLWSRVWVEGDDAAGQQVPSGPLLKLVAGATPRLQCVVWSACHSSRLARATVRAGVPCAVGMTDKVHEQTAIELARGFYTALGQLWPFAEALEAARLQAGLHRAVGVGVAEFAGDTGLRPRSLG